MFLFVFNDHCPTEINTYYHTLSLHYALPIWCGANRGQQVGRGGRSQTPQPRSGSCPERNARTSEKRKRAISAVSRKKVSPVLGRNTKADDRGTRCEIFSRFTAFRANCSPNCGSSGRKKASLDQKSTRLELQSLMRISYAVFCLKKKKSNTNTNNNI